MTPTTAKPASAEGKKDVQKLQRAIVDGLEDVKAQNIQVFDTEHITSLFERVIVASGTSNRQTKALAASVRDAVREAGFAKPRTEGEDNGEWIIVDCGAAVAHIMQPTIRQYYNLEELWGDKPVKLKLGAPAPAVKAAKADAPGGLASTPPKKRASGAKSAAAKDTPVAESTAAKKAARTDDGTYVGRVGKSNDWTARRNATAPAVEPDAKPVRASRKMTAASAAVATPVPVAKKAAATKKAVTRTPLVVVPAAKKTAAKKAATAKAPAKTAGKAPARSAARASAKKPVARKTTTRGE